MAIARVQSTSASTGVISTAGTVTLTFASPTTAGNVVIIGITTTKSEGLKVTSAHGIFAELSPQAFATTTTTINTKILWGVMTGADTVITIVETAAGSLSQLSAVAVEYSGLAIQPDNIPAPVAASGVNACNTGNLANTNPNALFVGVIGVGTQCASPNTSWAFNNISPFNIVAQNSTNNNSSATIDRAIVFLDAIVSTSSSRGANVNHGFGTNRYGGVLATFDSVGGGGLRAAGHGGLAS